MTRVRFARISVALRLLFSGAAALLPISVVADQLAATNPATGAGSAAGLSPRDLVDDASRNLAADKLELALQDVNMALELDPKNVAAYELRSSIYIKEKVWDRAERDIVAADKIAPDVAYKYKLGEIKYLQKDYGNARPRFAGLRADPRLGDLANYKVILCDLLAGHASIAARDLAALEGEKRAPYYFGHAAQALVNGKRAEANQWFSQAQKLYGAQMVALYVSSLEEIQLIQLQTATFTTKDGRQFDGARVSLETDGLRVAARTGWVTIPLDELPDDLSVFPDDLREQISRRRLAAANDEKPSSLLTFTTRSGHDYRQVRWALHDGGLAVLTDDGWISIPFAELPEDLSAFPPEVRTALAAKHDAPALDGATATLVSFETKSKKVYDEVRASVSDRGLSVLTANGWVTVPFTDLPSDLSPFPESWRNEISEGRDKAELTEMQWVSFTTRKGKAYDDVRALLLVDGLSVTTPEGIVRISFNQLPDDLSPFPASWRSVINQRRSAAGNLPASPVADKATAETSTPR